MIIDKIKSELEDAMREKDKEKVHILRLLMSEINNAEIELRGLKKVLTDDIIEKVLRKEAKKRKESIEIYSDAGRDDLVQSEKAELTAIEKYLPKQLSESEIVDIVKKVVEELGDSVNFGSAMKTSMKKLNGKADGKIVSEIVRKSLR